MAVIGKNTFSGFLKFMINNKVVIEDLTDREIVNQENKYLQHLALNMHVVVRSADN